MDWRDEGAVLLVRRHGEANAIVEVFTAEHGRHAGVVRGGAGRRQTPVLQPGAQLAVTWRARLDEHLGTYTVEPVKSRAAAIMGDRHALAALGAMTALLSFALPEREPHPRLYARSMAVLDLLGETPLWPLAYLHWELALLEEMGFGLDLTACAATGSADDLVYVSPKSGRAVSRAGAADWADRMLPLPACLRTTTPAPAADIAAGLRTTGHFLETWLAPALGDRPLPEARRRFVDAFTRHAAATA
jgi:DNA repair protein RecO (recombination protein O)